MPKAKSEKKLETPQNSKTPQTLILLDSHAIIHRAYHALPDFSSSHGVPTGALYGLSTMLLGIIEKFKPDYVVACYDLPQPTYRHEAYEGYKAGRAKTDDALVEQLKSSRKIFEAFSVPIYDKAGFEADDMLGTIVEVVTTAKSSEFKNMNIIIASGDMDTMQLVEGDRVRVYTLKKGIKDVVVYNEGAIIERFGFAPKSLPDYKGLRGDPSDNIIGIKGIGEKTATTLISAYGTIENIYEALKKDEKVLQKNTGLTDRMMELLKNGEEEAKFSKMLATIRRDAPIDFKLPQTKWIENVDIKKIEELFRELEFRMLPARAREVIAKSRGEEFADLGSGSSSGTVSTSVHASSKNSTSSEKEKNNHTIGATSSGVSGAINMSPEDAMLAEKIKVGYWIINSNKTNPELEDVFAYARIETKSDGQIISENISQNLRDAEKIIYADLEKKQSLKIAEEIEWPLLPVVQLMHDVGIRVNVGYLKILAGEYHRQLSKIEQKIWDMAGTEFNIASPKQLGEILFNVMNLGANLGRNKIKKTSTGAMSTKESELEKLKGEHPIVDLVMEHRELAKLLSTYIDTIPTLVGKDGRLHARFLLAGTTTGRMASADPNLQNIPIKTELGRRVRNAFVAEKGYKLVAIDYSQIELRIAAILSKDEKLLKMFKEGVDIHTGVAASVFKVAEKDVTKDMRRQAKVINFGILYGMGVNALKSNLGGTREEAQLFYNTYFETFTGISAYLNETKAEAKRLGYTETMFGRRRYFEGFKSPLPFIRATAERMAINAPIQGTEGDIVKIAMKNIHEFLQQEGLLNDVRLLLQVHDELVYEVREDLVSKITPKLQKIMQNVMSPDQTLGVPIETSAEVGDNWGEMDELK